MNTYTRNLIQFEKNIPENAFKRICDGIIGFSSEEGLSFLDYNKIVPMPESVREIAMFKDDTLCVCKDPAVLLYRFIQAERTSIKALWQVMKDTNEYDLLRLSDWAGIRIDEFCISSLMAFALTDFGKRLYTLGEAISKNIEKYGVGTYEEWAEKTGEQ